MLGYIVSILSGMSQEREGNFYTNPETRENCVNIEEGLLRAKRAENICDDALEISLKYVSEYSSPPPPLRYF